MQVDGGKKTTLSLCLHALRNHWLHWWSVPLPGHPGNVSAAHVPAHCINVRHCILTVNHFRESHHNRGRAVAILSASTECPTWARL